MEASLRAALKTGLSPTEFWPSTPYNVSMFMQERQRGRIELALYSGWFGERFARETTLEGPQRYIDDMLNGTGASEAVQQAMAEAELARMALTWGLEVEDIGEDE